MRPGNFIGTDFLDDLHLCILQILHHNLLHTRFLFQGKNKGFRKLVSVRRFLFCQPVSSCFQFIDHMWFPSGFPSAHFPVFRVVQNQLRTGNQSSGGGIRFRYFQTDIIVFDGSCHGSFPIDGPVLTDGKFLDGFIDQIAFQCLRFPDTVSSRRQPLQGNLAVFVCRISFSRIFRSRLVPDFKHNSRKHRAVSFADFLDDHLVPGILHLYGYVLISAAQDHLLLFSIQHIPRGGLDLLDQISSKLQFFGNGASVLYSDRIYDGSSFYQGCSTGSTDIRLCFDLKNSSCNWLTAPGVGLIDRDPSLDSCIFRLIFPGDSSLFCQSKFLLPASCITGRTLHFLHLEPALIFIGILQTIQTIILFRTVPIQTADALPPVPRPFETGKRCSFQCLLRLTVQFFHDNISLFFELYNRFRCITKLR